MEDDEPPPVRVIPIASAPKPSWIGRLHHTREGEGPPDAGQRADHHGPRPGIPGACSATTLFTDRRVLLRCPPPSTDNGFLMPGP